MNKTFKQALLFTAVLIVSASPLFSMQAWANPPPPTSNDFFSNNNYFNTAFNGWHGYVGVNYQQFSNNGTAFAESSTNKIYNISPSYQAGYNLGIGYLLPAQNTDIKLDYSTLHTSDSSNAWATSLTLSPTALGPVTWASSNVSFQYDTVSLTAGHYINFAPNFGVNMYGGLNYTHLTKDMTTRGHGFGNDIVVNVGTSYNGFGPTFGFESRCTPFNSYPNFNIVGGIQPTFLYGTLSGYVRTNVNDVRDSDNIPNDKLVVPAIGGKLGVNYDLPYRGAKFNFQLGYQVTEYFGVTRDSTYNNAINASLQGLYFNVGAGF